MSNSGSKGKSGNTGGGTETSFVNTPQAKDDALGSAGSSQLDYVGTIYVLDVMNNDLGGNAKSLWSVDDGVNNSGAMSGHEAGDLLTQDLPGVTGIAANRSQFGASLSVTADGRIAYDTSTIDAQYALDLTTLALGEIMTDSFIYAIRLASGTLSWARASVVLTGVNDAPVVQDVTLLAVEDGGAVTGAFSGDDIDSDDDGSTLVYTINGSPALGTLTNNGDGTFTYDPGTNFQSLAEGQELEIDLSYTATDSHDAVSAAGALRIVVTGINDAPVIENGSDGVGAVTGGDPLLHDSGLLQFSDADLTDAHTVTTAAVGSVLGNLTAAVTDDTTGSGVGGEIEWNYTVDNEAVRYLGAGDTKVESFTVTVDDGKGGTDTQQVDVTVTGINDVAVLGSAVANLIETDAQLSTGGTLSIADVDTGEAFFNAQSNVAGVHGSFSIDANGVWNYNSNGALDHLAAGQVVTDVFNVTSVDGTATTVTVSVTGTPDGPVAFDDANTLTASSSPSNADKTVYWVDWTGVTFESSVPGRNSVYSVQGTITLPTGTIGVTYHGQLEGIQLSGGTDFYVTKNGGYGGPVTSTAGAGVFTSAEVPNGPTNNDILQLNHIDSARTLTFSEPVANLFFAVVSMNKNGYLFDQDFKVVSSADSSSDSGFWGWADSYTKTNLGDGRYGISTPLTGNNEFHGVLAIENAVSSLTWTGQADEGRNGFTIGTYGKAQTATVSGNVLNNDDKGGPTATIEVSAAGGVNMVGNSVTLTLASGAVLKVDRDGDYFYDDKGMFASLGDGDSHQEVVQYTVRDNDGYTDTATLTITVNGVNDGPLAVADTATTNEDSAVTINVLANDTDPDNGDAKVLLGVTQGQKGTVSVSGNNVIYTPNANSNGNDTFSYTMRDAAGATSSAEVTVTINPLTDTYVIANLVSNGSFESGVTSWGQFGGGVDVVGDWQAVDGTRVIDLNAFERGELYQTLATTPGQTYTLGFNLSQNPGANEESIVRVAAGTVSQNFAFSQDSTQTDMKWEFKTLSFTADSNSSLLSFYSLTPSTPQGFPDDAEGPAIDEVVVLANRVLTDFDVGAGGDVLDMTGLMTSISAPHDGTAFSGGFVRFQNYGSDTVVQIDADGGGNEYMTAVTLIGVNLTQADTGNYIL
ncbi:MAG: VCBS domain-containing protein [Pseudohongiellaceae bacterium]